MSNLNINDATKEEFTKELAGSIETIIKDGTDILNVFSTYVDKEISKGHDISIICHNSYLSTLSGLAKTYSSFDYTQNFGQFNNFLALTSISASVFEGLKEEKEISELYLQSLDDLYAGSRGDNINPNRPSLTKDELAHKFTNCMEKLMPQELLQQKSGVPFILNEDTQGETVLDIIRSSEKEVGGSKKDTSPFKK